jgi:hypothetical protein
MIRVSKTFTRPNTGINWWHTTGPAEPYNAYRLSTYGAKLSNPVREDSSNGLAWTYSVTWASQVDYDNFLADSTIAQGIALRKAYNARNSIIEGVTSITAI